MQKQDKSINNRSVSGLFDPQQKGVLSMTKLLSLPGPLNVKLESPLSLLDVI